MLAPPFKLLSTSLSTAWLSTSPAAATSEAGKQNDLILPTALSPALECKAGCEEALRTLHLLSYLNFLGCPELKHFQLFSMNNGDNVIQPLEHRFGEIVEFLWSV